jgi:glutamyl-tRNA synthetase
MTEMKIRTRMAPSPTGELHVGSLAILLKNYAYAKRFAGQFILRIEDTDKTREVPGGVQEIQDIIHKFGLDWDEGPGKGGDFGPYIQSERLAIYREKVEELIQKDQAYYCFCSKERLDTLREEQRLRKEPPHYDQHCRQLSLAEAQERIAAGESYVVRLKVPKNQEITFTDLLRGEITFNSDQVDDQVLLKSDGYPTYHLAVVVDDHLMQITHVMRGEEWISSTPKHVLLYQAFGWEQPVFAHIPVFLNPDGKGKMSKRKGTVSAQSFLDRGYLPEALLNFLMILGWAKKDQEEIMTLDEYISEFDPKHVSSNSVAFDMNKLNWMNGIYIRKLSVADLAKKLEAFLPADFPREKIFAILPLIHDRLVTLAEVEELTEFFYRPIELDFDLLSKKATAELLVEQLDKTIAIVKELAPCGSEALETAIRRLQEENDWKKSQYFMMLRIAVTGRKATPPLFETMEVIGKELLLERLQTARHLLG